MNEIVNNVLLAGYKSMLETHLKQSELTCSACGPFTRNKERIGKLKETGDSRDIYRDKRDRACL